MDIEGQARLLAKENREAEPGITSVYWFPDENEVRLVELDTNAVPSDSRSMIPFYFRASRENGLPFPSAVALIHPDEKGSLKLPEGWCEWNEAVEIEVHE